MRFSFVAYVLLFALSACTIGIKDTPGVSAFKGGNFEHALALLNEEVKADEAPPAYALGTMYLRGNGVEQDIELAEAYLFRSATLGDYRAANSLKELYKSHSRCVLEQRLAKAWGGFATMHRNLITGRLEYQNASPLAGIFITIYSQPCGDLPPREDMARFWYQVSKNPYKIYVYIP